MTDDERLYEEIAKRDRQIVELTIECDDLQAGFDLRWKADMRAIDRWRGGDPAKALTMPDHTDLCVWLLERAEKAEAHIPTFAQIELQAARVGVLQERCDVMKVALERLARDEAITGGRPIKGNDHLPGDVGEFYKGYNAGIQVAFEKSSGIAIAALAECDTARIQHAAIPWQKTGAERGWSQRRMNEIG